MGTGISSTASARERPADVEYMQKSGGVKNEENLSAQEAAALQGARFPQENGYPQRPQGSCPPQSQGQSKTHLLSRSNAEMTAGDMLCSFRSR